MMFMPSNSLVIELVSGFHNVHMPFCGYYGMFSAIYGHHHYLHAYNYHTKQPISSDIAANKTRLFYDKTRDLFKVRNSLTNERGQLAQNQTTDTYVSENVTKIVAVEIPFV